MGNVSGGSEPGVNKSDEYPWGVKDINMPIPIEFARKLRNDMRVQEEYRRFIHSKEFRYFPTFINENRDKLLKKLYNEKEVLKIQIVKFDINGQILHLPTVLNPYTNIQDRIEPFTSGGMMYLPHVLNTAPVGLRQTIFDNMNQCIKMGYKCYFTDIPLLHAAIMTHRIGKKPDVLDNDISGLIDIQLADYTFDDTLTDKYNDKNVVLVFNNAFKAAMSIWDKNYTVLQKIDTITGRYCVDVAWHSIHGGHVTTVIMDNDERKFYVLDSNGVDECATGIYQYFVQALNFDPTHYTVVPIMPYKYRTTPRSFQHISSNAFCQTWNLFSRLLLIKNSFSTDVNTFIYDKVIAHAEPIFAASSHSIQINLTLICLEFMFWIRHDVFKNKFDNWLRIKQIYNVGYSKFMESDFVKQTYDQLITDTYNIVRENEPNLTREEFDESYDYDIYRDQIDNHMLKLFDRQWKNDSADIYEYDVPMNVREYIALRLQTDEDTPIDIFLDEELKTNI
jgi:hypothetical protein